MFRLNIQILVELITHKHALRSSLETPPYKYA